MQSCLEKRGITERNIEINKSDYTIENQYAHNTKDAIGDGDVQGKGAKDDSGHQTWKPHYYYSKDKTTKNVINYSNFTTHNENVGNCYDINGKNNISGRIKARSFSIFNPSYEYGRDIIGKKVKI